LTTDELFCRLATTGYSMPEIKRTEIRYLLMQRRAYERRMRRQEVHILGLRNELRSFAGADPIEDPYGTSSSTEQNTSKSEQARMMALKNMDLEGTEEMAPEEMAHLTN